ncbi:MAG TPA: nicotinic acid mononucleotide adenyltransferase [Flavobacteriaceae bacterium]|jgi:antitoxin component YwqK of YwqJK toxin-antitoxin module|nr:nicotinic acid mononucleotide adenyltransferase [Flavobacteriaceae bacterium]HIN99288.1 nicotinic acid mononucleotide adenyltransferase [Flavobacteriaceae bacterium]|tara:strand:+ start:49159 stop:49542 length:384 start_codon:yes stop_codon:yes gene_type:complete
MKKIITILVIGLVANVAMAQTCKKTCSKEVKDKYVLVDNLIEATLYHDNGAIAQTGHYTKDNQLQGEWVSYDANGKKLAVAQYENGAKVGTWKFYQGDTMKEVTYADSKIAKVSTWEAKDTRVVSYK